jgi:tRNA pseudouridine38-40 synthase
MVRGLVGTMLKTARGSLPEEEFPRILSHPDNTRTDFSVPAQGLFLTAVRYPEDFPWGETLS